MSLPGVAPGLGILRADFMDDAACAGSHDLFDETHFDTSAGNNLSRAYAEKACLAICSECPVLNECRDWVLDLRTPYGVVGGLTQTQRLQIWKESA